MLSSRRVRFTVQRSSADSAWLFPTGSMIARAPTRYRDFDSTDRLARNCPGPFETATAQLDLDTPGAQRLLVLAHDPNNPMIAFVFAAVPVDGLTMQLRAQVGGLSAGSTVDNFFARIDAAREQWASLLITAPTIVSEADGGAR